MGIKGKTYIITGGGSGLGEATARRFVADGANVIVADLKQHEDLARELGDRAMGVQCDVTSEEQAQAAIHTALEQFGGLHGVVNCAGIGFAHRTTTRGTPHPLEVFELVIRVNLVGSFNMIRLASTAMAELDPGEEGERGVFITTASVAAFDGQIGQASYSASKAGVAGMTLPIARDLSKLGMRCVCIAPGLFDTPMMAGLPEEARASLGAQVPFPARLGQPQEYAALAAHIAENRMLNGETIRLDGAIRMAPK